MSKSNTHKSQNSNPNPRKKNDPRYKRVIVGYRLVAMTADQVDQISEMEGRTDPRTAWWNAISKGPRCRKCFLRLPEGRKTHFCRWDIKQEGPRDPKPAMRQVPLYRWVLKE